MTEPTLRRLARRSGLAAAGAVATLAVALPTAASANGFTAHVHFPNHTPVMNKKWPITVTATKNGRKLNGKLKYQFLLGSTVEATRPGHRIRHGIAHDTLKFPPAAVGHKLTLRVLVITRYGTDRVSWTVTTRK